MNTKMHHLLKDFTASGRIDPDFNKLAKGDSVLNYMHFLHENRSMLMSLVKKELDSGAGEDRASLLAPSLRGSVTISSVPSSEATASWYDTEAKRSTRGKNAAFDTIAESSATMAFASKKRTASMTVRDMLAALESARAAKSSPTLIERLERRVVLCFDEWDAEEQPTRRARHSVPSDEPNLTRDVDEREHGGLSRGAIVDRASAGLSDEVNSARARDSAEVLEGKGTWIGQFLSEVVAQG